MNTKKIIAVSLSAIICSAIITPVASADDIGKKVAEEAVKNLRKQGIYKSQPNSKIVKYECTKVVATDEKGQGHLGDNEKGKEIVRKMAKQNGWKIKEYKGTCVKSVKI
ncbi:TPA: hypothetical protein IGZ65_002387, partial [Escherichia coli]|nr:hypothetical protein [Escherichia coli]